MRREEAVGKKFGKLLVVGWKNVHKNGRRYTYLSCACDCGIAKDILFENVTRGRSISCGCYLKSVLGKARITHGLTESKTYRIWCGIKSRCLNPKTPQFKDYGGRGIKICNRWLQSFHNFLSDMGECQTDFSIEREDVNGNYEPGNCIWIPRSKQAENRRDTIKVTLNGETKTIHEWCRIANIPVDRAKARLNRYGWSPEIVFDARDGRLEKRKTWLTPTP